MLAAALMRVIVIGCGVSGLSTAIRLREAGHEVRIEAERLPPETTSNVAAAIWYPYRADPLERVLPWGRRTFSVFEELASSNPLAGVQLVEGVEVISAAQADAPDPPWASSVRNFRRAHPDELPKGYAHGYAFTVPVIEMDVYLSYLVGRFRQSGGELAQRRIDRLDDPLSRSDAVVNCAGLGSRELVNDVSLFPIRGQVVIVGALFRRRFLLDERDLTYVIPRSNDCVLGGTEGVGDFSTEARVSETELILSRATKLLPELSHRPPKRVKVGLRPGRPTVRLERELVNGKPVVHNYGHGGAGVTLSWGCAEEAAGLLGQA